MAKNMTNAIIFRLESIVSSLNDEIWAEDEDFEYDWSIEVENVSNLTNTQYCQAIHNSLHLKDCETKIYDKCIIQINKSGKQTPFWEIEVFDSDSTNKDDVPFIFIGLRVVN